MKRFHWIGLLLAVFLLAGFGKQRLQHTYEGDVHLRWLEIQIEPLQLYDKEQSGDFAKITRIQKIWQSVGAMIDEEQNRVLYEQLNEFERILVEGIREASGVPLVAPEENFIRLSYDDSGQLAGVTYEYPHRDGAYMRLYGNIYYGSSSSSGFGEKGLNQTYVQVKPKLTLRIDGHKADRKLFWRQSVTHKSSQNYNFGNQFVLGLSTKRLEDGEIFLVPMARGVSADLLKKKEKGEL